MTTLDSFILHNYHLQVGVINLVLPVTADDNTLVLCSTRKPANGCHKLVYLALLLIFNVLNDTRHFYATRGTRRMGTCRKFNTISHNLECTSGLSLLSLDMFYVGVERSRGEVGFKGCVLCPGNGEWMISPSHGTVNNISCTSVIKLNCFLTHFARISSSPLHPWQKEEKKKNGIQEGRKVRNKFITQPNQLNKCILLLGVIWRNQLPQTCQHYETFLNLWQSVRLSSDKKSSLKWVSEKYEKIAKVEVGKNIMMDKNQMHLYTYFYERLYIPLGSFPIHSAVTYAAINYTLGRE